MTETKVLCRPVREEDYEGVHALRASEGMGDKDSPELWQRLYFQNPAFKRYPGDWSLGWVLEAEGRIVGYIGNIPQAYAYQGQTLFGGLGSGMVVHPDYRGKRRGHTARMIQSYCDQPADFLFNTTANIPAGRLWSSWGFTEVADTDLVTVFGRVVASSVQTALEKKKVPGALARLISYPICGLFNVKNVLRGGAFRGRGPVRQLDQFDERFDVFWQKFIQQHPDTLVKVSDREMLSWHFAPLLQQTPGGVLIKENALGELIGYAVLVNSSAPDSPVKRYWLADLKALDDSGEIVEELLENVFYVCRQKKVDMLKARGFPPAVRNQFARFPSRRDRTARGAFLKIPPSSACASLLKPQTWYFTPYDGDALL